MDDVRHVSRIITIKQQIRRNIELDSSGSHITPSPSKAHRCSGETFLSVHEAFQCTHWRCWRSWFVQSAFEELSCVCEDESKAKKDPCNCCVLQSTGDYQIKFVMDFVVTPADNSSDEFNSSQHLNADTDEQYHNVLMPSIYGVICFVGMPFLIHQLVGNGSWCFGATMCTVITALDSNSQIVSTYILTVMTLDRYLATVHPIRFKHIRTPCVAVAVVGLVWLLSLLSITPVWMYSGLMPLRDGSVGCALLLPNPATDTYWFTLYQFVLAFALPLVIICVVFFKILQNMAATVAPLPQHSLRMRTRKVTRMAVAICLAFFICWAPHYILQLAHLSVQRPSYAFLYAYNVAISMGYANSCINPLLYIMLSETFKRQFIVAIRPAHKDFRVDPADGSVSLRLAPDGAQQSQSSRELLPVTVAVH
ncbi:melanin-concentrating hormone receptor 1-like isoform X2 [Cyprinus carpio]|uniref:Melanin-concentrating hormone receptor 1-like isoform X2 n=1 Tax=Cyprinus carpio TaxID=7962 RepID=A0A9R0A4Z5_CYPCA|nr:melanin-concentrating hormone receptor 1-like isoform X2 [Cyprinus carpio]